MTIWDGGWPDQSEPERESEWHDPDDADDSWKDEGVKAEDGEGWKHRYPDEDKAGPEYWLYRGMQDAEDERDETRKRRRREERDDDSA